MARVGWRILPLLTLIFLVSVIDRSNIGFAKLQMLRDLRMTEATYGLGASLFFIGYFLFEVPSTVAVHRFGARRWLARIIGAWSVITVLLAFTPSVAMFYGLRFLLGAAEAGAFPGIVYFLTLWFPRTHLVRAMAVITLGSALGNMFGSILSGAVLDLQGTLGLAGWQWVFIATGVPAMLLTGAVLKWLPNSPHDARFLTGAEKEWIASIVRSEGSPPERRVLTVLWDARVLFFATVYALIMISLHGVIYWLPTVVHSFGVTGSQNGLLNAIPWATAAIALSSLPELRRREEDVVSRMSVLALVGLVSFFASTMVSSNWARLVAVSIGTPCISLLMPCFWSLPARRWSGPHGAAAIGAISSAGNLGGFLAQNLMPWVGHAAGNSVAPMAVPAICLTVLGIGAWGVRLSSRRQVPAAA
jgi:MFS family permease